MKNALDFFISYNRLESLNFIQRFASAYMFLEALADPAAVYSDPDTGGHCVGCKPDCKQNTATKIRCAFFFLFNTMSGNSSIRCHFDGKPTEMQRLIGDSGDVGNGCGSDFTVDFLFGYTGYEYRKCTDTAKFSDEIIASIDAGKPVIAKLKSGSPRFHLITGYNGDALISPNFTSRNWDFEKNCCGEDIPEEPPVYDELDVLYIFGAKTTRRYTLKDGLYNIRRAMECNINENVLDGYLTKLSGWGKSPSDDGFGKVSPEERKTRARRLHETVMYVYNICSFNGAFGCAEKLHSHYLHKELFAPAFSDLWNEINDPHWTILNAGHAMGGFRNRDWLTVNPSEIPIIGAKMCEEIVKIKEADIKLLDIVKQAISVLENKEIK